MKVEDVMSTNLIVGYVPGTVKDALKTLAKHNVSGMPILKKDSKVLLSALSIPLCSEPHPSSPFPCPKE